MDASVASDKELRSISLVFIPPRFKYQRLALPFIYRISLLQVTGDLSPDDKWQLGGRLNRDQALLVAAYMSAAHDYLETNSVNTPYTGTNEYTGRTMRYNFRNVDQQLEGKVSFHALIAASRRLYDNPNGGERSDPGNYRGGSSLEILAAGLKAEPLREK